MRRSRAAKADEACETAEAEQVRLGGSPTGALGLGDREDDRAETRRCEHGAAEVETLPARLEGVGRDDLQCGDRECCCDGEVDVEDHPPVGELGQDAADEHADRSTSAADRAPGGESLRPLRALEGGHDDRERRRGEHRCAETLARSSGEEGTGGAGHRRGERGRGEDAEAGQEHPAPSEQVGGAAAEEEQAAEDQRVARDRPADARPVRSRSRARLGSAMFTAVMSRMTISCAISSTESSRPLFFGAWAWSCFGAAWSSSLNRTSVSEILNQT